MNLRSIPRVLTCVAIIVASTASWAQAAAAASPDFVAGLTGYYIPEDSGPRSDWLKFVDDDGDDITSMAATPIEHGTLTTSVDLSGSEGEMTVTYQPAPNWYGIETTTISATDSNGDTGTTTVTFSVSSVNDAPTALDDGYVTVEDQPVGGNVLDNDIDVENETLNIASNTEPANGTLTLNADGTFTYTPDANFHGTDSFTYVAEDYADGSNTATVNLSVLSVDDNPVVTGAHPTIDEDTDALGVRISAIDPDGTTVTPGTSIVTGPLNGIASIDTTVPATNPTSAELFYEYIPYPNFHGTDTVTFRFTDDNGGATTHTETITVNPVNDAPTADAATFPGNQETALTGTLTGDDIDGDVLTFAVDTPPGDGTATVLDPTTGDFTYTPDPGFSGTDSFVFSVDDGNGATDTATITLTINGTPLVDDTTISGTEDTELPIDVHDLAADPDHAAGDLTYTIITPTSSGTLVDDTPGDTTDGPFTYTPNPDFDGTDTFDLQACDPDGLCDTGTITIDLTPVNDAPVVDDDTLAVTVDEDGTVTGDVPVTDPDNTDDDFTYTISTQPEHGTATAGSFTYTPDANFHGADSFAVTVCDPSGACDTTTVDVTVTPVNDAPTAPGEPDSIAATVGDTVTLDAPITDIDDDPLTFTWTQTAGPPVQLTGPNQEAAAFAASQAGTYTFDVTACDPDGECITRTVQVDVNDAPVRIAGIPVTALPITGTNPTTTALAGLALITTGLVLARRNRYRPRHLRTP